MGGDAAGLKLAGLVVAWLGGVLLPSLQPAVWPVAACIATLCMGAVLLLAALQARGPARQMRWPAALIALAMLGAGSSGWRAAAVMAEALPADLENRDLLVEGSVSGLPRAVPGGLRFVFEVDRATQAGVPVAVPHRLLRRPR